MNMKRRAVVWACLMSIFMPLVAAAACVEAEGGIGGSGMPLEKNVLASEGGIGGTGIQASGGIGGTGIVGTITGFASVCINGLEVSYDAATRVTHNGEQSGIQQLEIGQVIAINARNVKDAGLLAQEIDIQNTTEGPLTALNPAENLLEVMGQKVRLSDSTRWGGIADVQRLTLGTLLQVSGYRNETGEILASRIEVAGKVSVASVVGTVSRDKTGQLRISGTPVQGIVGALATGEEVLVKGKWDGHRLQAEKVQRDPALKVAGQAGQVVIEGLATHRVEGVQLRMGGFDIDVSTLPPLDARGMEKLMQGNLVRVTGRMQSGSRVQAYHLQIMPVSRGADNSSKLNRVLRSNQMQQPMKPMHQDRMMNMMKH